MATKKPLVQYGGQIDELHAGDLISGDVTGFTGTNNNASPITIGQPVYKNSTTSQVDLADATDDTKNCIGLVGEASIAASATGYIQTGESLTMADWTIIIGSTNLTPGADYYLDTTAGKLTATAPSTSGNITQLVGKAVSATELLLTIRERILLA